MSEEGKNLTDKSLDSNNQNSLYRLIYLMVRDQNQSIIVHSIAILITLMQIHYFKFHHMIVSVWQDNNAEILTEIFGYFNFTHYLLNQDYNAVQILIYVSIALLCFWVFLFLISIIFIVNQKDPVQLLINILKYLTFVFSTILYIPMLFLFTFPISCTDGYMDSFSNQKCWQGLLVIDQIISIIGLIILSFMCSAVNYLFFDGSFDQEKALSKRNGRCATLTSTHFGIVVLLSMLPHNDNSQVFFEVYQLVGSVICFLYAKRNDAYNNRLMQKLFLTFLTLEMWASLMLCISNLVEKRIMVGSLYTWLFCLPFVFMIQLLQQQKREQCLMIYVNKFDNPVQLVNHVHEVIKLVEYDKKRLPQGQLLNGYIEFHNQTCPNPLCPLKKVKFSLNMFKAKNELVSKTDKRHQLIYDTMTRLFILGIGKFPTDVFIRIEYALFTLRILKSKPQALEELSNIEKLKSSFDEKYIVFYIKSVIEAEISELSGEGQDFTEQRDFDEKFGSFKQAMERSVSLLMEFWSQFADDKPDLIKLYEIGSKLFPIRMYVDTTWKRLQRIQNQQLPQALRLYSKYLIEIFNDRISGFDLLEQARKIESSFSQRKAFKLGMTSNLNVDGQEDGCVFISLEEEKFGQIYAINMAAASLLGFDKNELMNKKINNIMPSLYARHHDDFLRRFLDTNEATLLNKERLLLGKHKNGYLQGINVLLRPVYHVLKEGVEFVGTFKKEKRIKDIAYLICNKEYVVEDISGGCINLLGLDVKSLQIQEIHLFDLFPEIKECYGDFKIKQGKSIDFILPKILDDHIAFGASDTTIRLSVSIQDINFLIMKNSENEQGLAGYQVRVEKQIDLSNSNIKQLQQKLSKNQNFSFRLQFQQTGMHFYGEFTDANYSEMITHIQDQSMFTNQEYDLKSKEIEKNEDVIDYSSGIRVMRLFEGVIYDIEKFQSDADMESYEEIQIKKEEQQNQENDEPNESGYFRSSKELQETLNAQSESRTIRWLYYISFLLTILLIILCILNNIFEREEINNQNSDWNMIVKQSDMITYLNEIVLYSRELMLLNLGISYYKQDKLLFNLNNSIEQFDSMSKDIFMKISFNSDVMMNTQSGKEISTLEQASQQIVSKSLNIEQVFSQLNENQIDYYYVIYNSLNDFIRALLEMYMNTIDLSYDHTNKLYSDILVILILSACLTFISSIILTCILTSTLDKRQEILSIFLDIPEKTAKLFYSKCENFLSQISSNEDDEVLSEIDIIEEKGNDEPVSLLGRKRKRFKNNENKHIGFFIKMILLASIIESYFIMIYFLDQNNADQKINILNEFNQTSLSSSYYSILVNSLKQYIYNDTLNLMNQNSNSTIVQLINNVYEIDTLYQKLHAINVEYNDISYIDYYNTIMFDNLCTTITFQEITCDTFANGILDHGLMTAVSRHFQNIRKLYNTYQTLNQNVSLDFPWSNYSLLELSNDPKRNKLLNLLNTPESFEINDMQFYVIKDAFKLLKNKYLDIITTDQENYIVQQLILMIFFLLTLILALLFCWNPFLRKLNREIWSTKCLLTFIPIDEIAKIRTINNYIRTVILEQNI
ncbi:unnamed protein product [Paramecium pentaurelia]|uniref:PAS domain-containing protein n=1 Tax=Paramecium pentaurelia TaxID=43138 RepID=A0A8S1SRE3_9CILI|nr:unnamed protein product [Paramecium pentaurelia]